MLFTNSQLSAVMKKALLFFACIALLASCASGPTSSAGKNKTPNITRIDEIDMDNFEYADDVDSTEQVDNAEAVDEMLDDELESGVAQSNPFDNPEYADGVNPDDLSESDNPFDNPQYADGAEAIDGQDAVSDLYADDTEAFVYEAPESQDVVLDNQSAEQTGDSGLATDTTETAEPFVPYVNPLLQFGPNPYLQTPPYVSSHAQLDFTQAVDLMREEKWQEARTVLLRLHAENPQLSGPAYNLAVIEVALGNPFAAEESAENNADNKAAGDGSEKDDSENLASTESTDTELAKADSNSETKAAQDAEIAASLNDNLQSADANLDPNNPFDNPQYAEGVEPESLASDNPFDNPQYAEGVEGFDANESDELGQALEVELDAAQADSDSVPNVIEAKEPSNAVEWLDAAIARNNYNFKARNLRAQLYREQAKFSEAEAEYKAIIELWGAYLPAYKNLGILYDLYMGKLAPALEQYRRFDELSEGSDKQVKGWIAVIERQMPAPVIEEPVGQTMLAEGEGLSASPELDASGVAETLTEEQAVQVQTELSDGSQAIDPLAEQANIEAVDVSSEEERAPVALTEEEAEALVRDALESYEATLDENSAAETASADLEAVEKEENEAVSHE